MIQQATASDKSEKKNLAGHEAPKPYIPKNKVRIVTAASLFDGHDAAINIMRRIIQATGCEVIHLGHDRSVEEVVNTAIQEDAQAIAMTSYQGGHNEYFKYMHDLLREKGAEHIKVSGTGKTQKVSGTNGTVGYCNSLLGVYLCCFARRSRSVARGSCMSL